MAPAAGGSRRRIGCIARSLSALLLAGLLLAVYDRLVPSAIDPAAFSPQPASPLPAAPGDALDRAERLGKGLVHGPEDVAVDGRDRIYGGQVDGRIVRMQQDGSGLETFADTGGRPLGLAFGADGRLYVADAVKGLLAVDEDGTIEVLATEAAGLRFGFTDDLDIARDGSIYFSDASHRFGVGDYLYDLLEARPHGRLLVYRPSSRQIEVLADDLYFANGVALAADERFVLVNETYRYRIRRYWLRGPRAGSLDIFADRLPGFADGIASDRRGSFWVAFFTVRNASIDRLHPWPLAKRWLARLPKTLWPKPARYGLVAAYDEAGHMLRALHDRDGDHVPNIASVEPVGEDLYLGTLDHDWIGRVRLSIDSP